MAGQASAKRALEIVAAGGHSLWLTGPAGCGKTLLARCLPGLLPPLTEEQAAALQEIYAAAGEPQAPEAGERPPFRDPPPDLTIPGLLGSRRGEPRPGEVSLAHRGVLCLDDLHRFPKATLAALPKVLDDGSVRLRGASGYRTYPSSFLWVATLRACPCGRDRALERCRCTDGEQRRFRRRVPQSLRDRVDLVVEVGSVGEEELTRGGGEHSREVAQRVAAARKRQRQRNASLLEDAGAGRPSRWLNGELMADQVRRVCTLDEPGSVLLSAARERLHLSARRRFQVLKVARTIADLAGAGTVRAPYLAEAVQYWMLDSGNKESAR